MKKKVAVGVTSLGLLVGTAVHQKDVLVDKAARMAMPTQYVMYERGKIGQLIILKERPIRINDDKYVVQEDKVYRTQASCALPVPEFDPEPSDAVVPWGITKTKSIKAMEVNDGSDIVVCIADTGVANHPDLKVVGGFDAVGGSSYLDDNGHGTHVAGTVAAIRNNRDVVGVSQAKIYASKVLNSWGSGYSSQIASGIVACVDQGKAKVINLSLGSPASAGVDELIREAILYAHSKNVITVCANGNDSGAVGYPAKYCNYAVSATDSRDGLASFSSRGPETDVAAPGVDVLSLSYKGGTETMSGTSMATPHVAGAIALMLSAGKTELGVDDINLPVSEMGRGRLNSLKTVE